jgi:hypothetical protein
MLTWQWLLDLNLRHIYKGNFNFFELKCRNKTCIKNIFEKGHQKNYKIEKLQIYLSFLLIVFLSKSFAYLKLF